MFTFSKLRDRLYQLRFDDSYEMCMAFLRYQEFYESPRYGGRKFTIAEFMSWYTKAQSKGETFSYPLDWGGFNIPADVIETVHAMGIDDPNHYDSLMKGVYGMISAQCDDAYLIGVGKNAGLDAHEITHAMYHIDDEYRKACRSIISSYPAAVTAIEDILFKMGYSQITARDEVQAYLTTGDKPIEAARKVPGYKALQKEIKRIHKQRYPIFTKDIKK